jgi:hypothetical protein
VPSRSAGLRPPFIRQHEHLGIVGKCQIFFGLRAPGGRLFGVAGFGYNPQGAGGDAVLERGACLPGAPRNAESFLIGRALCLGRRLSTGAPSKAYSDERFGQYLRGVELIVAATFAARPGTFTGVATISS